MNRGQHGRLGLPAVALAGIAWTGAGAAAQATPEQLVERLRNEDDDRVATARALIAAGAAAVPPLLALIRDPAVAGGRDDRQWRLNNLQNRYRGIDETTGLPSRAWVEGRAQRGLRWIRDDGCLYRRWGPKLVATYVLGEIAEPDALETLRELSVGDDLELRCQAVQALTRFGRAGHRAMGLALGAPGSGRIAAMHVAELAETAANEAAEILRPALAADDATTREHALLALGHATTAARALEAELIALLANDNAFTGSQAAWVMSRRGREAVPGLMQVLLGADRRARRRATIALAAMGTEARPAAFAVMEQLADPDEDLASWAACALQAMELRGEPARIAAPHLVAASQRDSAAVRVAALEVLGKIGAGDPAYEHELRRLLRVNDPAIGGRASARLALARELFEHAGGPTDRLEALQIALDVGAPAIDEVVAMLSAGTPSVRGRALDYGRIGPDAVPRLVELVREGTIESRRAALETLARIDRGGHDVSEVVLSAARDPDDALRNKAIALLSSLVDDVAVTVRYHMTLLASDDTRVQYLAASALGRLGIAARPAVPNLITALESGSSMVRGAAARALGLIGPAARAALPHLERVARDPSRTVASHARLALQRIRR